MLKLAVSPSTHLTSVAEYFLPYATEGASCLGVSGFGVFFFG